MKVLYKSHSGYGVKRLSYSAASDFNSCPRKFKIKRIDGWQQREKKAALEFGNAIEAALQAYHETPNSDMRVERMFSTFEESWSKHRGNKELTYSDKEGSWEDMHRMGQDMLRLYVIKLPKFPIRNPRFQLRFRKEVFPGSEYRGIEDQGWFDMVVDDGPNGLPLIVDIKTSTMAPVYSSDFLALDPQLRRYAWLSGIHQIGFLWFQKMGLSVKKGDDVTLLIDTGLIEAGEQVTVLSHNKEQNTVTVCLPGNYANYEHESKGLRNKKADAVLERYIAEFGVTVSAENVTKQRVSFSMTTISEEAARDAGEQVGEEVIKIVAAHESGVYRQNPGVRFPDNKCLMCEFHSICRGDNEERDKVLVQIGSARSAVPEAPAPDWLELLERGE